MNRRLLWWGRDLSSAPKYGSIWTEIAKYRMKRDRKIVDGVFEFANLISSKTTAGTHRPIIDLDFPHKYVPSTTEGHAHLFLDVELPRWRWIVLTIALRIGGVTEFGCMVWSLRRGANFVRVEGLGKTEAEYSQQPEPVPVFVKRKVDKRQP